MSRIRFITTLCVSIFGCCNNDSMKNPAPNLSLQLGQPVEDTKLPWLKKDNEFLDTFAISDPVSLSISFGNQKSLRTFSKITYLSQDSGKVSRIVATPLKEPVSFEKATEAIVGMSDFLGEREKKELADQANKWKTARPDWGPFGKVSCLITQTDGSKLYYEIRSAPEEGKWFISLGVYSKSF